MEPQQQKRVLIVDDDASVRELLSSVLRHRGISFDLAHDGRQAIELLHQNHYSVVVLDLVLPHVDGFGVLDAIGDALTDPPVVLVLTGAEGRVTDRLDPRRIHGVVRKPFDAEELASVIEACADVRARGSFGTMAIATMMTGAPLLALLSTSKI